MVAWAGRPTLRGMREPAAALLVTLVLAVVPASASAAVVVLSPGTRSVEASGGTTSSLQSTQPGEFDATQSAAYPLSSGTYMGSSSGQLTSNVNPNGVQVSATLGADCLDAYDPDGAYAEGSNFVFQVTSPTSVRIQGSLSVQGTFSGFSEAFVALDVGGWNGQSLANSNTIFLQSWTPSSSYTGNWVLGTSFDQTVSLAPGYYEFRWLGDLAEGSGNPLANITGSGTMVFSTALTLSTVSTSIPTTTPVSELALGIVLVGFGLVRVTRARPQIRHSF